MSMLKRFGGGGNENESVELYEALRKDVELESAFIEFFLDLGLRWFVAFGLYDTLRL